MKKENKSDLRREILTQYIELLVANGEYIGHLLGAPLNKWDYTKIVDLILEYSDKDYLWLEEDARIEIKNTLNKLNN
tara:strand:+ start:68 stop:298 length:231 start_codon:yes stop_codon:yes gene_type:complete